MIGPPSTPENPEIPWAERISGCSKLCFILAGIGLSLGSLSSAYTFRALHEPLEAAGLAITSHLAATSCVAISETLAALAAARSARLSEPLIHAPVSSDLSAVSGVVTPGSWRLEGFQGSVLSPAQARALLQTLPLNAAASPPPPVAPGVPGSAARAQKPNHGCEHLGNGLDPRSIRVYAIANPGVGSQGKHGGRSLDTDPNGWLAFLYGPFAADGQPSVAFALVDLPAATRRISAQDHDLEHHLGPAIPADSLRLNLRLSVAPAGAEPGTEPRAYGPIHGGVTERQLLATRSVPFANQVVRIELSMDHHRLDRLARRAAAFVLLISGLATAAVVLVSRRSELKSRRLNQLLLEESRTDGLTRVANRRAWDEALLREDGRRRRHGQRYGLLVVDLDGFKQINDSQGHAQGDALLLQAALALKAGLRDTDLLARVGGDEFAVLVFNPSADGLDELARRLREGLRQVGIAASIGAALNEEASTLEQTWMEADHAMYRAKSRSSAPPSGDPGRRSRSSTAAAP